MESTFTVAPYELEAIARDGHGRINVKVQGYWSMDPITLYIDRDWIRTEGAWRLNLSHSSGGRDPKEVADDLVAECNFARAMIAMAEEGMKIRECFEQMEAWYQDEKVIRKAQADAEAAAKQAIIDADPVIGMARAYGIVEQMVAEVKDGGAWASSVFKLFNRGHDRPVQVIASKYRVKTVFTVGGYSMGKKEVIERIARASVRSEFQTVPA